MKVESGLSQKNWVIDKNKKFFIKKCIFHRLLMYKNASSVKKTLAKMCLIFDSISLVQWKVYYKINMLENIISIQTYVIYHCIINYWKKYNLVFL